MEQRLRKYISILLLTIGLIFLVYLHLYGTGLLISIAASMPGSEAVW
jgi:hypothetical protein